MVENRQVMAKNIKKYMMLKDVTVKELCNALGFKKSTFYDWLNGNAYPRIDKIEMMANYFGIKKSDLVETTDELPFSMYKHTKNQSDIQYGNFYDSNRIESALMLYDRFLEATPKTQNIILQLLDME